MKNDFEIRGNHVAIFLNRRDGTRLETLIDMSDFPTAVRFPGAWVAREYEPGVFYAMGIHNGRGVSLARLIWGAPAGFEVDHIHHSTLDNRRSETRVVIPVLNKLNQKSVAGATRSGRRWRAQISIRGRCTYLGTFSTEQEARAAFELSKRALVASIDATAPIPAVVKYEFDSVLSPSTFGNLARAWLAGAGYKRCARCRLYRCDFTSMGNIACGPCNSKHAAAAYRKKHPEVQRVRVSKYARAVPHA